jgi:hypothetical protein
MTTIIWTEYLKYKAVLRGFNLQTIEEIVRYSPERYYDTATGRWVVVGKDGRVLVMVPHEVGENDSITPITIHATTRQQVNHRVKSGRFVK